MKYMGSKRSMLQNGLGDILRVEAKSSSRFVDLFCGAGSVSWFAAINFDMPVFAIDLQKYATVLASAVIERVDFVDIQKLTNSWLSTAEKKRQEFNGWSKAIQLDNNNMNTAAWREKSQEMCSENRRDSGGTIWRAYGGHYFSPSQALTIDAMISSLPNDDKYRNLCLAATIIAASHCVASPGHTAQPFKATKTAGRYLREAWRRDPINYAKKALRELCPMYAKTLGASLITDANIYAKKLKASDLIFVDPPYSGVHYSRFYHVLETIARGKCGEVSGVGRYPPSEERPVSKYSRKSEAMDAMSDLLESLAQSGSTTILTFPNDKCSNGISGSMVETFAKKYFRVTRRVIKSRFSTLGGNRINREARRLSDELILVLKTK